MKILILCLCYFLSGITTSSAYPPRDFRPRRSYPHQAMMFSGFYRQPNYQPQSAMSAFATRDAVATNTFAGNDYPPYFIPAEEEEDEESKQEFKPELSEETSDRATVDEELEIPTTVAPKREPTRKLKPTRAPRPTKAQKEDDDEEDDDSASWPLQSGRKGHPGFNAFFPIIFGSRGATSRSGDFEGGLPGSATAIANSFSTGKGGVASSHATAYGDPYLSMLLRSGGNPKRRNSHKNYEQ